MKMRFLPLFASIAITSAFVPAMAAAPAATSKASAPAASLPVVTPPAVAATAPINWSNQATCNVIWGVQNSQPADGTPFQEKLMTLTLDQGAGVTSYSGSAQFKFANLEVDIKATFGQSTRPLLEQEMILRKDGKIISKSSTFSSSIYSPGGRSHFIMTNASIYNAEAFDLVDKSTSTPPLTYKQAMDQLYPNGAPAFSAAIIRCTTSDLKEQTIN